MTRPLKRVMDGGKPISTEAMEREENRQIGQGIIFLKKDANKNKLTKNLRPAVLYITLRNKSGRILHKRQQEEVIILGLTREQNFTLSC